MSLAVIVALALCAALGAWMLWTGLRGVIAHQRPTCRKCRFDLSGLETPVRCPECGADLGPRRAVKFGARARRPLRILLGSVLLAPGLGAAGVAAWAYFGAHEIEPHLPEWALEVEAVRGVGRPAKAVTELLRRQRSAPLDSGRLTRLAAHGLALQSDAAHTWDPKWGDLIEEAKIAGCVTGAQWNQYYLGALSVNLRCRSRIHPSQKVPVGFAIAAVRGGSQDVARGKGGVGVKVGRIVLSLTEEGTAEARTIEAEAKGWGMQMEIRPVTLISRVDLSSLPPASYTGTVRVALSGKPAPFDLPLRLPVAAWGKLDASGELSFPVRLEVVPEGTPVVRLVPDPSKQKAFEHAFGWERYQPVFLELRKGGTENAQLYYSYIYHDLPGPVSFRVFGRETLQDGTTRDWPLPDMLVEHPANDHQRGSTTIPISPEFNAAELDVHFVADERPALEMLGLDEAWDGEVVIPKVVVGREGSRR